MLFQLQSKVVETVDPSLFSLLDTVFILLNLFYSCLEDNWNTSRWTLNNNQSINHNSTFILSLLSFTENTSRLDKIKATVRNARVRAPNVIFESFLSWERKVKKKWTLEKEKCKMSTFHVFISPFRVVISTLAFSCNIYTDIYVCNWLYFDVLYSMMALLS